MIFNNKNAAFSYPILSVHSHSYNDAHFNFTITDVIEGGINQSEYLLKFTYQISSKFIKGLLREGKAELILIIQSADNYFKKINLGEEQIILSKNRLSLSANTKIQLHIRALKEITFEDCHDLSPFYNQLKHEIKVDQNSILGFSNVEILLGQETNRTELFEYSIDDALEIPFEVVLTENSILLKFQSRLYNFNDYATNSALINLYLYVGLDRAISQFLISYGDPDDEFELYLEDIDQSGLTTLHLKLYQLMMNKGLEVLNLESIDLIINQITDQIVEKFVRSVVEAIENEN